MSKMKILLLTIDVWNDSTNGNNCYTNWFENFDAEFANIYLGPGVRIIISVPNIFKCQIK